MSATGKICEILTPGLLDAAPHFSFVKEGSDFCAISRILKLFISGRGPRLVNKLEFSLRQL